MVLAKIIGRTSERCPEFEYVARLESSLALHTLPMQHFKHLVFKTAHKDFISSLKTSLHGGLFIKGQKQMLKSLCSYFLSMHLMFLSSAQTDVRMSLQQQ